MHHNGGMRAQRLRHVSGNQASRKSGFHLAMEGYASAEESLVTVEFHDLGNSTEVTLTHERLPNPEERDKHAQGGTVAWTNCQISVGCSI